MKCNLKRDNNNITTIELNILFLTEMHDYKSFKPRFNFIFRIKMFKSFINGQYILELIFYMKYFHNNTQRILMKIMSQINNQD